MAEGGMASEEYRTFLQVIRDRTENKYLISISMDVMHSYVIFFFYCTQSMFIATIRKHGRQWVLFHTSEFKKFTLYKKVFLLISKSFFCFMIVFWVFVGN